jgi:hypothetical protein
LDSLFELESSCEEQPLAASVQEDGLWLGWGLGAVEAVLVDSASESPLVLLFAVLVLEEVDDVDGVRPLRGCEFSLSTCFDLGGVREPVASSAEFAVRCVSVPSGLTHTSFVPLPYPRTRISWKDVDMRFRDLGVCSTTLLWLELE